MNKFIFVVLFLILTVPAFAGGKLSSVEIERVRAFKQLTTDVDKKSLETVLREIENTKDPQMTLQISEAIAQVYQELVREKEVVDLEARQWLYGMISLNMANLQFGGKQTGASGPLNRLITKKLKENLPEGIFENPHFHVSIE